LQGDLERTVMRSEIEGPVYAKPVRGPNGLRMLVENASDPSLPIPWDGTDRVHKRFNPPKITLSKNSLTVELMSIIREMQILTSVDSTVESSQIQAIIHTKMKENPNLRHIYMSYLKKEI